MGKVRSALIVQNDFSWEQFATLSHKNQHIPIYPISSALTIGILKGDSIIS
ncbi:hypothetical protein AC96_0739 [Escherichia coli 2-156-04_S4_C2]|nr:hypothetical protein AC96_0739 [Escherichia coli 2-156-04_S4_C2]